MNKKSISLVLGLMCLVLTCGIAIQVKTVKGSGTTVSTNKHARTCLDCEYKDEEFCDMVFMTTAENTETYHNYECSKCKDTGYIEKDGVESSVHLPSILMDTVFFNWLQNFLHPPGSFCHIGNKVSYMTKNL